MKYIVHFSDPRCVERALVGGKGANLGVLTSAGFPVPRGFVVAKGAYDIFVGESLRPRIADAVATVDYSDAESVENVSRSIREMVAGAKMPQQIASEITAAYASLGADSFVAVRSSGTAEDLADASFAGQHDTYLDMRGTEVVLDAVKRCWASLWTARAMAYRNANGFDHFTVSLAVVIQEMVEADVAGVMFTANPLSTATDQIVVNASWGLGEGVVSGILTPDQFTLKKKTGRLLHSLVGAKEVKVIRNPVTGRGVITEPVAAEQRNMATLTTNQLGALAELGRRVEEHYGGMPQDIEWALANGAFYLLQARDITGVDFTWDEDVDAWQSIPDDDVVWTRAFADEFWTGAVTPLFYSVRAREHTECQRRVSALWGFPDLARAPRLKYHKAEVYLSTKYQEIYLRRVVPKRFRTGPAVDYLPASMKTEAARWPFSLARYLWAHVRILLAPSQSVHRWMDVLQSYLDDRIHEANGLSPAELRRLSDDELKRHIAELIAFATEVLDAMWSGFFLHGSAALYSLGAILAKWYDGENAMVYTDLLTGLPKRTITVEENLALWEFADEIRRSPELLELFRCSDENSFFASLAKHPAGASAAAKYARFVEAHGHRGHADRDFWFKRRAEDPAVDYRALKALLTMTTATRPDENESKLAKVREAAIADVSERLRRKPFGSLRVRLFKAILGYAYKFLIIRDDERHYMDRITFAKKRAFDELGRRLLERGLLKEENDHYFLTDKELLDLFDGRTSIRLAHAKTRGRRRQFEAFHTKKYMPPLYLRGGQEYRDDQGSSDLQDVSRLTGLGTSRGTATGTARVVHDLKDIDRIRAGDILVTNSTDPGWTPVFALIGGLVLETGGMLAHGSCLSREYGLPAATIPNATKLIEDGATITVDGDTGQVHISEPVSTAELREAIM